MNLALSYLCTSRIIQNYRIFFNEKWKMLHFLMSPILSWATYWDLFVRCVSVRPSRSFWLVTQYLLFLELSCINMINIDNVFSFDRPVKSEHGVISVSQANDMHFMISLSISGNLLFQCIVIIDTFHKINNKNYKKSPVACCWYETW